MPNAIPVGSSNIASQMADIASSPNATLSKYASRYRGVSVTTKYHQS
jgi:hypothetical protein